MKTGYSFRTKFIFFLCLALFIAFAATSYPYYRSISEEILASTQKQVVRELEFIHQMLTREMEFQNEEELHDWLVLIGKGLEFRVTYMADGGTVIADSHVPRNEIQAMDNHARRPEMMEAREKAMGIAVRFSGSTQEKQLYVAKVIEGRGPIPSGIIRVSTPFQEAKNLQSSVAGAWTVLCLILLSVMFITTFFLFRGLQNPLAQMIHALKSIGNGDYKQRIYFNTANEFYPLGQTINEMAQHLADHVKEVSQEQQQFQAIFDGMQEGVMVLNANGRIKSVNRAMSQVIPKPSQFIGKKPLEAIMNLELQDACDRIMATGANLGRQPISLQLELEPEKFYEVNMVRMHEKNKNLGAILVFHNISPLKRLEKVRRDFVANVTHELRTPLTSIKGYTETLLSESEQDKEMVRSFLETILKNTNHMVKMVDDLLHLARMESKKTVSRATPVDAAEAAQLAWKECLPLAQSKNIGLENLLPDKGLTVWSNLEQLTQVFRNLMENAIKYSPEKSTLKLFSNEEAKAFIFAVQDQGLGIPSEHQQRVFERFYRMERHRGSDSGSTGLGLAICKHIVQSYGGKIWLQSPNLDNSIGCTFFFSLPKATLQKQNAAPLDRDDTSRNEN